MKKPKKKDVIESFQGALLYFVLLQGFLLTYLELWGVVGLPTEWWAIPIVFVLSAVSIVGLICWLKDGNAED